MRRKRRNVPSGDYVDPLSNYDTPQYEDEMERSLTEDQVTEIKITPFLTILPDITIEQAVQRMSELNVACLLIAEDDRLTGILTARDVLKVAEQWDQMKDRPVCELMTCTPTTAYETDSPAKVINIMTVGDFRHVPVLDVDDKVVGVLGPKRLISYLQEHAQQGRTPPT